VSVYTGWQIRVLVADAGGVVEVRKDGQPILTFNGDTRNGGTDVLIDRVSVIRPANGNNSFFTHYYIGNALGAVNNGFPGDGRVYTLIPGGAGDVTGLTPTGSATNWQNVDDALGANPNDADFNGSAVDGTLDTYGFTDLPVAVGIVKGVQILTRAIKSDAGAKQGRRILRRAAANAVGPDLPVGVAAQSFFEVVELDPHAGPGAWTVANVAATQGGFEVRP
jgi:hypothetical protein